MSDNSDYRPAPDLPPLKLPTKQEIAAEPAIAKLPAAPKFVSPMPKIEESDSEVPAFLPVVAGIAAVATLAFTVLIYLKR